MGACGSNDTQSTDQAEDHQKQQKVQHEELEKDNLVISSNIIEDINTNELSDEEAARKSELPDELQTQVTVKKQRRRLSVAPSQVGAIQKQQQQQQQNKRMSMVGAKHLNENTEKETAPKKFVAISKKGFVPYNPNKVNQDSYFCDYTFGGNDTEPSKCKLFGVCDGHGEKGHLVSQFVAKKLPKYILQEKYVEDPKNALKRACKKLSQTLRKSKINTSFSGTTLVFSLLVDNKIYTANLGDSRCILVNDKNEIEELSIDHKPDLPDEKERIIAANGRVAPLPGPVGEDTGPMRVWLADIDVPGLAMSRSLGDDVAHTVGVSDIPEILEHEIDPEHDYFMVWASDGIWEFLPNEDVSDIIQKQLPNLRNAALALVKQAIASWKEEEEVIDDITAVIFNLKQSLLIDQQKQEEQEVEAE